MPRKPASTFEWSDSLKRTLAEERAQALALDLPEFITWWRDNRPGALVYGGDPDRSARRCWLYHTLERRKTALAKKRGECPHCKQTMPAPNRPKRKR